MDDFRTEPLGAPAQVSNTLTPEPHQESEVHPRRRAKPVKRSAAKPPSDPKPDEIPHEVDELA